MNLNEMNFPIQFFEETPTEIDLSLDSYKAIQLQELNTQLENFLNLCSKDTPIARETWWLQRELAYKYLSDPTDTKTSALLSKIAVVEDEGLDNLANKIIHQSETLSVIVCELLGIYRKGLKRINASETEETVESNVNTTLAEMVNYLETISIL